MDSSAEETLRVISHALPVLIGVLTISPLWTLVASFRRTRTVAQDALYQDKDGVATKESMAAYSTTRQFILVFIGTGLGLAASFSLAVFATVNSQSFDILSIWLLNLSWVGHLLPKSRDSCLHMSGIHPLASPGCFPRDTHCSTLPARRGRCNIGSLSCGPCWNSLDLKLTSISGAGSLCRYHSRANSVCSHS
jgi:hypothetical protein